ncbi:hypothetical protein, partial [Escherichia coli]
REKQKGSRGIRRGQRYRLVFQFPIRQEIQVPVFMVWQKTTPNEEINFCADDDYAGSYARSQFCL